MTDKIDNIPKDVLNRARIWVESLQKAYSYVLLIKNISDFNADTSNYLEYQFANKKAFLHIGLTTNAGLLDSSIIHYNSIFASGYSNEAIAGNMKDNRIENLRNEIVQNCIDELGWSKTEYEHFFDKIKIQRDGLLAHYDATKSDYKEIPNIGYSMKMVGSHLLPEEISKFKDLIKTMLEVTFKIAYK